MGYDEMIALASQIQQRLEDFAAHPDDYHDGTYREPPKEDIPCYHDFYYARPVPTRLPPTLPKATVLPLSARSALSANTHTATASMAA